MIKNNNINFYFILVLFFLNFTFIYSIDPPQSEQDCYISIINKLNLSYYYKNSDGTYKSFCSLSTSGCHNNNGSVKIFYGKAHDTFDTVTPGAKLTLSDTSCFPYLTGYVIGGIVADEFLYNKQPMVTTANLDFSYLTEVTQKFADYDQLIFIAPGVRNLKLSYINGIRSLTTITSALLIERDSQVDTSKLSIFSGTVLNFPNFDGYNFSSLTLKLDKNYQDVSDVLNYQYVKAYQVDIFADSSLTIPFYPHLNTNIKKLTHNGVFQAPNKIYDLGDSYEGISLAFTGPSFFYNNQVPVKVGSNSNLHFSSSVVANSAISTVMPSIKNVGYLKTASYDYSFITGNLPEYDNTFGSLGHTYQNNRLTGTISQSWCNTTISVANNLLTGTIPSCFSCYFKSTLLFVGGYSGMNSVVVMPTVFKRFEGNSFTNYDKDLPCTTYKPQVTVVDKNTLRIFGIDIGHDVGHYYIDSPGSNYQCLRQVTSVIKMGYEYICKINAFIDYTNKDSILLYNIGNGINYQMAIKSKPPVISKVTISNNVISLSGSFFSNYLGQSSQTLSVGNVNCQIGATSFSSVSCPVGSIALSSERKLVVLKNDNQIKKVFAVFESDKVNDKTCTNDCVGNPNGDICDLSTGECVGCPNGCSGSNGVCDEVIGKCECASNYQGLDCSIPYIECPKTSNGICNNVGICTNTTGKCTCDSPYTSSDCSIINCPNDCTSPSQGTCNTQNGKCTCESGFEGSDCSIKKCPNDCSNAGTCNDGICTCNDGRLFSDCSGISCPNDCTSSSQGTCNTSNGKCTCKSGFEGSDCGLKKCPNDCSNAGTCNGVTGECKCNSNFQGEDCSIPYIPCPVYDNFACNNVGKCDNTTGKCTCDSPYTSSDCSIINCPNDCTSSSHGICNTKTGKCACESGFEGSDCSIKKCPNDCSNAGTCNDGICTCNDGRLFSDCSGVSCPNDCTSSSQGTCNTSNGKCTCEEGFEGSDCSIKKCPNDCSNAGTCNDGICTCNNGRLFSDCSGISCPNDCTSSSQGTCNTLNGKCKCEEGYQGESCEFIEHYLTSVYPTNENGGEASFIGHFGKDHNQLSIKIGKNDCNVTFTSSDQINCTALPGTGIHNVNMTQNNISYFVKNFYEYIKINKTIECPKNCSSNGICIESGVCECYEGYSSFDCSSISNENNSNNNSTTNPPITNIDNNTGIVDIKNEKINFNIYLYALKEVDIENNVIKTYSLISDWAVNKTESNIYIFEQKPNDDEFTVTSTIELVSKERNVSFAGVDFKLEKGSTKFTISVKNYKYQSFLNTLQLEMISNVTEIKSDKCNKKETNLNADYFNNQYQSNYIKLSKNNFDFVGRFINKVESDSKPTFLSTSYINANDSVIVSLHLPHCVEQCLIDPDFSVLLSSDFSDCKSPKENIKWQIPTGVVVGVVGASCIGILFYKKSSILKVNGKKIDMNSK